LKEEYRLARAKGHNSWVAKSVGQHGIAQADSLVYFRSKL